MKQLNPDEQLNIKLQLSRMLIGRFYKCFRPPDLMQKCFISQAGRNVFLFCIISLGLCAEDYILIYCLLWLDLCLSLGLNHILFTADLLYCFLSVLLFCPNIAV